VGVNLSKENNNTADICGKVKYFKYVFKKRGGGFTRMI